MQTPVFFIGKDPEVIANIKKNKIWREKIFLKGKKYVRNYHLFDFRSTYEYSGSI